VGLFNPHSHEAKKLGFSWADLGISGKRELRDVLNQKSLGRHKDGFSAVVPGHGVCLLKISA
jgi:alpha-galactosidase